MDGMYKFGDNAKKIKKLAVLTGHPFFWITGHARGS